MKYMKYEFLLHTWGGFYNKRYKKTHGETEGYHYFETKKERSNYLKKLRKIEKELKASSLVAQESEGYNTRAVTTLHRVIRFNGKKYYSKNKISPSFSYEEAKFMLEYKWYPGFNDYPLGSDFDYKSNQVEIMQEWITGAFDNTDG